MYIETLFADPYTARHNIRKIGNRMGGQWEVFQLAAIFQHFVLI